MTGDELRFEVQVLDVGLPARRDDQPASIETDALQDYLAPATPWTATPVGLALNVTLTLWGLLGTDVVVSGWLIGVNADAFPCSGMLCSASTFGEHPTLTLILAAASSLALLILSVLTRGFTEGSRRTLAAACVSAIVAVVATVGAVLVVFTLAVAVVVALALAIAVLLLLTQRR
jgi:hypothetical protein